jgi:hypothetical protein
VSDGGKVRARTEREREEEGREVVFVVGGGRDRKGRERKEGEKGIVSVVGERKGARNEGKREEEEREVAFVFGEKGGRGLWNFFPGSENFLAGGTEQVPREEVPENRCHCYTARNVLKKK